MNIRNKNFLIIGGSSGIGLEIVKRLAAMEANIYTVSRSNGDSAGDQKIQHLSFDVTSEDFIPLQEFLPETLHGLAYCPGTITLKPFARLTTADFLNDLEINLLGAVKTIQSAIPALKKSEGASVVLFSTVAARTGLNFHASIASAKAAVEGLTVSLAAEYASANIRFNAIAPSITQTPLAQQLLSNEQKIEASKNRHPLKRIGQPEDLAAMAAFLLSPESSWVTGQVIGVDGGLSSLKPL